MGKPFAAVAFFALIASPALAIEILYPQLASTMRANVSDSGSIIVEGGRMLEYELNLSVPQNTPYQEAAVSAETAVDSEGNRIASIRRASPEPPYEYSVTTSVVSHSQSTVMLPGAYTVPLEVQRYLLPSPSVQSQDPRIAKLARGIVANSSSAFEAVARLAIWVHYYVEYDEREAGAQRDALWVLENRRGVCVEYTTLFMALAKSAGIPVRYVSGYTYSSKYGGWLGHSWSEAYVGKWIPVDPTWLEAGHLGATYITLKSSAGPTLDKSVSALVSPSSATIQLEGDGGSFLGKAAENIVVCDGCIEFENRSGNFGLSPIAPAIRPGGKNLVIMSLVPADYRIASLDLQPCTGQEFIRVEGGTAQSAILERGRRENIIWEIYAGRPGQEGMVYTCPFTLNSAFFEEKVAEIKVDSRSGPQMPFEAWVEGTKIAAGQAQRVFIRANWSGVFGIASEGARSEVQVRAGEVASAEILPERLGQNEIFVYSDSGNYQKLAYEVADSAPVQIERITVPERIFEGSLVPLRVDFVAPESGPVQAKISVQFGNSSATVHYAPIGRESMAVAVRAPAAGRQNLRVEMESGGGRQIKAYDITVLAQPKVAIQDFKSEYNSGMARVSLSFMISGNASNIGAEIGGVPVELAWSASGLHGAASVPYGRHRVAITWRDSAGNTYSSTETIGVEPPSGVLLELPAQNDEGRLPCLPAAIFAIAVAASFARSD